MYLQRLRTARAHWVSQQGASGFGSRASHRALGRKMAKLKAQVMVRKNTKTCNILYRLRQQQVDSQRCRQEWRMATWNTRGLGATAGYVDQTLKIQNVIDRMIQQKWGILVLTELLFREDEVCTYKHMGRTWQHRLVRDELCQAGSGFSTTSSKVISPDPFSSLPRCLPFWSFSISILRSFTIQERVYPTWVPPG